VLDQEPIGEIEVVNCSYLLLGYLGFELIKYLLGYRYENSIVLLFVCYKPFQYLY
jgi:hypothetical protein